MRRWRVEVVPERASFLVFKPGITHEARIYGPYAGPLYHWLPALMEHVRDCARQEEPTA